MEFSELNWEMSQGMLIFFIIFMIFMMIIGIITLIASWKIFTKAGEKGWKVLIPIYNAIIFYRILGLHWIYVLLPLFTGLVPGIGQIVSLAFSIYTCVMLARSFNKSEAFGLGIFFLSPIFIPMLGFGEAKYIGPSVDKNTFPGNFPKQG